MGKPKEEKVVFNRQFKDCVNSNERYLIHVGGTRCISGDTMVKTINGYIPASDVTEKTFVSTGRCYRRPVQVYKEKTDKVKYKITLKSGEVIKCTEDHEFFTSDGGSASLKLLLSLWNGNMDNNT